MTIRKVWESLGTVDRWCFACAGAGCASLLAFSFVGALWNIWRIIEVLTGAGR